MLYRPRKPMEMTVRAAHWKWSQCDVMNLTAIIEKSLHCTNQPCAVPTRLEAVIACEHAVHTQLFQSK